MLKLILYQPIGDGLCWVLFSWPLRSGMTKLCGMWIIARFSKILLWMIC